MNQAQPSPVAFSRWVNEQFNRARHLHAEGQLARADEVCKNLLAKVPEHQGSLHLRVMINRDAGHLTLADELLQRLTALAGGDNPDVLYEWGVLRYHQGRPKEAEASLKKLIGLKPGHANGHMVLGRIYDKIGRLGAADIQLRHALELRPDDETISKDLASINERLGLFDTGIRFARLAYNLNPSYVDAIIIWAKLEEGRGDTAKAQTLLEQAEALRPGDPLIALMRGYMLRRRGEFEQALASLQAIDEARLNPEALSLTLQERGFCLERLGRYDEAFASFSAMSENNRRPPMNRNYPTEVMRNEFEAMRAFWAGVDIDALPKVKPGVTGEPTPVFVLGFPRSGTTLVEQIVTSHPGAIAGDEIHALDLALGRRSGSSSDSPLLGASQRLLAPDGGKAATALRQQYMTQVRRQAVLEPGYSYFTDKTPLNETHMGLIHAILPEAPMVHLVRHPLNVVLSSFFNDVRHGRNFATRLETTAQHYAHTMDLVETYCERLPDLRYLRVRYEDVVNDLEGSARQIIDFIGLPWDERCLDFHENKRHVRTASANQVKEKLYTRSLERYKPFLKQLEPVIPILEPYIEKLGYTI